MVFGTPASGAASDHLRMVEVPDEERRNGRGVAERFSQAVVGALHLASVRGMRYAQCKPQRASLVRRFMLTDPKPREND